MEYTAGYPESIESYANKLIKYPEVIELLKEYEITNPQYFFDHVCELAFGRFLKGDEIILNESEFEKALNYGFVSCSLAKLEEEKLVINISDDDENPRYVITEKGKAYVKMTENLFDDEKE